jgi:hypothetical protein
MATSKPRITVTLDPHLHSLLASISDSSGQPMSGIVNEFLSASTPVLEKMANTFTALRSMRADQKAAVLAALDEGQDAMGSLVAQSLDQYDLFMTKATHSGGSSAPLAHDAPQKAGPPITNRGGTNPTTKPRKLNPSKALEPVSKSEKKSKNSKVSRG